MGSFCPECESNKGFDENHDCLDCGTHNVSIVRTEGVSVAEDAEHQRETPEEVTIPLNKKPKLIALIVMIISVSLVYMIPLEEIGYTPFLMLIVFFLSSIPFFLPDATLAKLKIIRHSKKGMWVEIAKN